MADEPPSRPVPVEPDPETATRVGWILTAVLFLIGVVSLLGEVLGWWNDLGEIGTVVGTLGSLVVGVATYQHGADRRQVAGVRSAVEDNGDKLGKLDKLDKLDSMDAKLDELDELDRIQVELDAQTGVLEDVRDLLSEG